MDGWNTLVNSGDITLFPNFAATDLNSVYSEIQRYNFIVMRLRDAAEEESKRPLVDDLPRRSTVLKKKARDMENNLLCKTLPKTKEWLNNALEEEKSRRGQTKRF